MNLLDLRDIVDQAIRAGHGELDVMVDDDGCLFEVQRLDHSHTVPEGESWDYPREFDNKTKPYMVLER